MKAFLTGSTGILGTEISTAFESKNCEVLGFNSTNLNLCNLAEVERKVAEFKPDYIIHCAAMTAVDRCETERDLAYAINVTGTENIALAALKADCKMVYISSCGVYGNGKISPYHEMDDTNPVNYHHYTKLEGEKKVKLHHKDAIIIRPGWLFGGTVTHQKNFVEARRREAMQQSVLKSAADKHGSPTYTKDVAAQMLALLDGQHSGIYNVVNEETATRFSYVSEIVSLLKLPVTVEPVDSNLFPRPAKMPDNEVLENRNLNLDKCNLMRNWKEALKDYIATNYG